MVDLELSRENANPRGVHQPIWPILSRKIKENEEILGSGTHSSRLLDPPLHRKNIQKNTFLKNKY